MIKNKTGLSEEELLALPQATIITRGEQGSTIYAGGDVAGASGTKPGSRRRPLDIPAVAPEIQGEPTGVGDAYRGGVIKGMLRGYSWQTTGRIAGLAATFALEHQGTVNHRYTVQQFVDRYRRVFGDTPELQDLLAN